MSGRGRREAGKKEEEEGREELEWAWTGKNVAVAGASFPRAGPRD